MTSETVGATYSVTITLQLRKGVEVVHLAHLDHKHGPIHFFAVGDSTERWTRVDEKDDTVYQLCTLDRVKEEWLVPCGRRHRVNFIKKNLCTHCVYQYGAQRATGIPEEWLS